MRPIAILALLAACSSSQVETGDPQNVTATRACKVVDVDDEVSPLEEGLGSLYDLDNEGISEADEDAEWVIVRATEIQLGHHRFATEDGDSIENPKRDEYVVTPSGSDERYTIRLFSETGLGVMLFGSGADGERLATLDCRGALDVEPPDDDVSKMSSCNVVWVDDELNASTLEEGLGSIYDVDDDGFPEADGDATSVDISSEREITIGHHGFSEADGDVIAVEDADDYLTYVIRPKGNDEVFSVRIFRHANDAGIAGIGVVIYQNTASARDEQLAVLDCRGIDAPQ